MVWSERTNQLQTLFNKSRREDLQIYVQKFVEEEIQIYIQPTIRFISFGIDRDEGPYIDSFTCRDDQGREIDLWEEDNWKPEYQEDSDKYDEVPDWDDVVNELSGDIAWEIAELRLANQGFDLFEKVGE